MKKNHHDPTLRPEEGRVGILGQDIVEIVDDQDEEDQTKVCDDPPEGLGENARGDIEAEAEALVKVVDATPRKAKELAKKAVNDEAEVGIGQVYRDEKRPRKNPVLNRLNRLAFEG
jgi:hypothetical protein